MYFIIGKNNPKSAIYDALHDDEENTDASRVFNFKLASEKINKNESDLHVTHLFPNNETLKSLQKEWKFSIFATCPTNSIRRYFGERIAM